MKYFQLTIFVILFWANEINAGSSSEVSSGSEPEFAVQRPLDGFGGVIMKCSSSLGCACQTRRKSMEAYCSCGENLYCKNEKCVRDGTAASLVAEFDGQCNKVDQVSTRFPGQETFVGQVPTGKR